MGDLPFLNNMGSLSYEEHKRRLAAGGFALAIVPLGGVEDQDNSFFKLVQESL